MESGDRAGSTPRVSVLTPNWNCAPYLEATYRSLADQTEPRWEWIVADDGSTDSSRGVLAGIAARDPRVRVIHNANSGLPAVGRNTALAASRAPYVALLDSDDLFHPEKLARQADLLDAEPALGGSFHDLDSFWSEELGRTGEPGFGWLRVPCDEPTVQILLSRGNFVPTTSLMLRRALLDPATFMDTDPELRGVEDFDFILRFLRTSRLRRLSGVWGRYRVRDTSLYSQAALDHDAMLRGLQRTHRMLEKKGFLALNGAVAFLAEYHTYRAELLLWKLAPECRGEFLRAIRCAPANPKRWVSLLGFVLPLPAFRDFYFWLRRTVTHQPDFAQPTAPEAASR